MLILFSFPGFEVNVLSYLVDIKAELSRISAQVSAIAAGCESTDTEEEFILPLNTEAQLEKIELKLHDRSARKSLVDSIQFYLYNCVLFKFVQYMYD